MTSPLRHTRKSRTCAFMLQKRNACMHACWMRSSDFTDHYTLKKRSYFTLPRDRFKCSKKRAASLVFFEPSCAANIRFGCSRLYFGIEREKTMRSKQNMRFLMLLYVQNCMYDIFLFARYAMFSVDVAVSECSLSLLCLICLICLLCSICLLS